MESNMEEEGDDDEDNEDEGLKDSSIDRFAWGETFIVQNFLNTK